MDIDERAWPIVTMSWEGLPTDDALTTFLARLDCWLDGEQRFGLLLDTRRSGVLTPEQRVRVLGHMKAQASRTTRLLVQAIVIESLAQRTLFYGINMLFRNPFPSRAFADVESAQTWIESELAKDR